MNLTVGFHQKYSQGAIRRAVELLGDVHAPARSWADEHGYAPNQDAQQCFTVGYLTATVGSLLDALGLPEHGPNVDQHSWLVDDTDDEYEAWT